MPDSPHFHICEVCALYCLSGRASKALPSQAKGHKIKDMTVYPSVAGMCISRISPSSIPSTPWSHPRMTSPPPATYVNGCPLSFVHLYRRKQQATCPVNGQSRHEATTRGAGQTRKAAPELLPRLALEKKIPGRVHLDLGFDTITSGVAAQRANRVHPAATACQHTCLRLGPALECFRSRNLALECSWKRTPTRQMRRSQAPT